MRAVERAARLAGRRCRVWSAVLPRPGAPLSRTPQPAAWQARAMGSDPRAPLPTTGFRVTRLPDGSENPVDDPNSGDVDDPEAPEPQFAQPKGVLVRDHIHKVLYAPGEGYFARPDVPVVHRAAAPLDFAAMRGQSEYTQHLGRLYGATQSAWLTPVEIFQPHYAQAVARFIQHVRRTHDPAGAPLTVMEVGGGNGTAAVNILDFLRDSDPDVYASTTYHLVEVSPALAAAQRDRLDSAGHAARARVHNMSITDWQEMLPEGAFIIGLEVLDNLAHDKVVFIRGRVRQVEVVTRPDGSLGEVLQPVDDALVAEYLKLHLLARGQAASSEGVLDVLRRMLGRLDGRSDAMFLPTTQLAMLKALARFAPKHRALFADFDHLPGAISGRNGPLVSVRSQLSDGGARDYGDYLVPVGAADIFFPTDFAMLEFVYRQVCGQRGKAYGTAEFLRLFADVDATRTRTGYNPMLRDYSNTKVFVTDFAEPARPS